MEKREGLPVSNVRYFQTATNSGTLAPYRKPKEGTAGEARPKKRDQAFAKSPGFKPDIDEAREARWKQEGLCSRRK